MKWGKNCGDQRNYENRLEKEIKKKLKKKKKVWFVENYENKNTHTNKLIISTMSKKTNISEIWDGDEVSKKLRQSKSMCKKTEKICKKCVRYI